MPQSQVNSGFALLEVLVSILVVSIGLLGAAGMFVRAIEFTVDTERRQMAAMVAGELLEIMRADSANILRADGTPKDDLGGYAKPEGVPLSATSTCDSASPQPASRLACWIQRARSLMPDLQDDLVTSHFSVVPQGNGVVAVTVAWPVKKGQCLREGEVDASTYCSYRLLSKL